MGYEFLDEKWENSFKSFSSFDFRLGGSNLFVGNFSGHFYQCSESNEKRETKRVMKWVKRWEWNNHLILNFFCATIAL